MKFMPLFMLLSIVSASTALPALGVYHDEFGELIMAIDDSGNLYELTQQGWMLTGDPCPGEEPYSIELVKLDGLDDTVFILVFARDGKLFQTDGSGWTTLLDSQEEAVSPSLSLLLNLTEVNLSVMAIDANGVLSFGTTGGNWQILPDRVSSFPARDIDFFIDDETQSLFPFLLGSDGRVYGYSEEGWASSEFIGLTVELERFEIEKNQDTGFILMLAIDESGNIYDNIASDELALTEHDPCPGAGPWELEVNYVDGSGFDLLCIDSSGCLHLANGGSWDRITDSFPVD
ncbi:MAG: hypothetical protein K8R76_00320 [Candidatus Aegiribacteria sp.]|nr:hypothetical protein [Candidatus Aegiribacteria sp.]